MTKSSTSKGASGKARHTRRRTTPKLDAEKTRSARRETNSKVDTDKAQDADRKTASVGAEKVRHERGKVNVAAEKARASAHKIDVQVETPIESHGNSAPKVAAEKPSGADPEATAAFERAAEVPDSMRALAERNVAQMQALYEGSAYALRTAYKNWENSFDALGQGTMALNRKFIDIAERNIGSGFDLAKSLAGAKDIAEVMEVQMSFCRKQFVELRLQAEEVRVLLQKVAAGVVTKPR
jgi:hypothetical protein